LLRSNEGLLKSYLSGLIKDWKNSHILHLVLEDLNMLNDKSYYEHKGIKIKYTRLSRLLRFGQIKHWIASMAEKQGMFTHFVNPAYTSQECSVCHYISSNNRKNQEEFICKNPQCNHKENADLNSPKVIKSRLLNNNLRYKLGKDNVYLCNRNNITNYKRVKSIVSSEYNTGVVTELLPRAKALAKTKEAPSFRAE
jgi:IS605 OrfB family transposase